MDEKQILEQIKTTETADLAPETVAEVYALTVASISGFLSEADIRRLILLGAAMYRNSTNERHISLQMPRSDDGESEILDDQGRRILH